MSWYFLVYLNHEFFDSFGRFIVQNMKFGFETTFFLLFLDFHVGIDNLGFTLSINRVGEYGICVRTLDDHNICVAFS